jgi:hypothetical protein
MVLQGDEVQVDAHFIHLEIVLTLTQYRCTVCLERTIRSEIVVGRTRWIS